MIKKRLDELKMTGALPSPTGVGLAILDLTRAEDYSMTEITRVISSDPALTGRIIKLSNSAAQAGMEPAKDVQEAAMRLGVRAVRNLALSFTLVNGNRGGACKGFDYDLYWSHSLATAVAAQCLASRIKLVVPAGSHDGRSLRMEGHGAPKLKGKGRGDLIARLRVQVPRELSDKQAEALRAFAALDDRDPRETLFS